MYDEIESWISQIKKTDQPPDEEPKNDALLATKPRPDIKDYSVGLLGNTRSSVKWKKGTYHDGLITKFLASIHMKG